MKKLVFLTVFVTSNFFAQAGFQQGNALYRQEKFPEAAEAYEAVVKSGRESAELYFNLGNAYYKMNKVAPAIYNYEKALVLAPGDADVKNNLKFAHKMMIDEVKETQKVGFEKILSDFTGAVTYDTWAWIAVAMSVLIFAFFCGYYLSGNPRVKQIFFFAMFTVGGISAVCVLAAVYARATSNSERPAIVFESVISVKSEPQATAGDVAVLHEGTKVFVLDRLDAWTKVRLPDGSDGWLEKSAIKEVKQPEPPYPRVP